MYICTERVALCLHILVLFNKVYSILYIFFRVVVGIFAALLALRHRLLRLEAAPTTPAPAQPALPL